MANQRHVRRLQKNIEEWNVWRARFPEIQPDLSHADLRFTKLSNADLRDVNMCASNLSNADLSEANLSRANLYEANLQKAILIRADLRTAYIRKANLSEANLHEANLRGVDLSMSHFYKTKLTKANLYMANLKWTDFNETDLSDTDLGNSSLNQAKLSETLLNGADLSRAKIERTTFNSIDLSTIKGLKSINHQGPSYISTSTLEKSGSDIPEAFLRGAGLSNKSIEYAQSMFEKPIEYYTCFISYSSADSLFAQKLHKNLQQEGVRCWFAPEDMDIGDKIKRRIDESIRIYDKLLLVLSKHSIESSWVNYEVDRALHKEPQGVPDVLYPVRIDQAILNCEKPWAKDIMNTRHIGDFEEWTNPLKYQESFKRLLRALNAKKEQGKP